MVSENDLKNMRAIVHGHILAPNLELNMMQIARLSGSMWQSSEILTLLKQLKSDVVDFTRSLVSTDNALTVSGSPGTRAMENAENHPTLVSLSDGVLQVSIARLTKLVKENECIIESDNAELLIHDLQTLLESAQGEDFDSAPQVSPGQHGCQYNMTVSNVFKELKLAKGLVQSAPVIAVNRRGMIQSVVRAKATTSDDM
jgi:hypothetical protein